MSGLSEIWSWAEALYEKMEWEQMTDLEIYDYINSLFEEQGRSSLDTILGNDKEVFFKLMERKRKLLEKQKGIITINVSGYQYIRNGKTVIVPPYTRRYKI